MLVVHSEFFFIVTCCIINHVISCCDYFLSLLQNWFQNKRAKEKKVAAKHHEPLHRMDSTAGPIMQPQQLTPLFSPITYSTSSTIVQSEITAISPTPPYSSTIPYPMLSPWAAHSGRLPFMCPPVTSTPAIFPYMPPAPIQFPPFNELIPPP